MREWLESYQIPMLCVATKIDKLPKSKIDKHISMIRDALNLPPTEGVFQFSALTKGGVQNIWKAIWQAATQAAS